MRIQEVTKRHGELSRACVAAVLALFVTVTALGLTACGRTTTAATTSTSSPAVLGTGASGGATAQHGLVWKFKTGAAVRSSLAAADGVVYVGSDDGYLYAVDGATGRERWRFKTGKVVDWRSSPYPPLVAGHVVYAGSDDGCLRAVDTGSGRERWEFETGGTIRSSPAVAKGLVYVGSTDGCLYAVESATGKQRWTFKTGDEILSSPAVAKGLVYVGSTDGHLYAVESATGKQRWTFKPVAVLGCDSPRLWRPSPAEVRRLPGEPIYASPVVVGRLVYVNDGLGQLHALDSATGRWRWSYETGGVDGSAFVSGGVLYQSYYALGPSTGKRLWGFEPNGKRSGGPGGHPVLADGLAYYGWSCGLGCCATLVVVGRKSGHEEWTFAREDGAPTDPNKRLAFSPAVADGVVYFAAQDGHLYALDRKSGEEQWSFKPDLPASCSPTVSGGIVYFGSYDGCLYAVK